MILSKYYGRFCIKLFFPFCIRNPSFSTSSKWNDIKEKLCSTHTPKKKKNNLWLCSRNFSLLKSFCSFSQKVCRILKCSPCLICFHCVQTCWFVWWVSNFFWAKLLLLRILVLVVTHNTVVNVVYFMHNMHSKLHIIFTIRIHIHFECTF